MSDATITHVQAEIVSNEAPATEALPADDEIRLGAWYRRDGRDVVCVTHIGTNYVKVKCPHRDPASLVPRYPGEDPPSWQAYTKRIHLSDFWGMCVPEPNAEAYFAEHTVATNARVIALLQEVRNLSQQLAVAPTEAAAAQGGLVLRTGPDVDVDAYKKALTLAQKKTLPELFDRIKEEQEHLAAWMGAPALPLEAEIGCLSGMRDAVKSRIFAVEIYAGLIEEVVTIRDGVPAPRDERVRIFQRRHYMDEECLLRYEAGGMRFADIQAFDAWLAQPENMDRLLPFPRCALAFRVRRFEREGHGRSLSDFVTLMQEARDAKRTYLYLRNGEQLYRLETAMDFGEHLFETQRAPGELWAEMFGSRVDRVLNRTELRQARAEDKEHRWKREFIRFHPTSVYYDDIARFLRERDEKHNHLVLLLQGLFDRSPVFSPHPPWSLWSDSGFTAAVELVFDGTRTIAPGEKPDFEAYRQRLAATIAVGSVTIGQEALWEQRETDKFHAANPSSYRERFTPYGDPGPGFLARVAAVRGDQCRFDWTREGQRGQNVPCSIWCPKSELFHASAYTRGDFHLFFDDPRTRADYVKWAPFLLGSEDFVRGKRKAQEPVARPKRKPPNPFSRNAMRAEEKRRARAMHGQAVRLRREITITDGRTFAKDSLWRAEHQRGTCLRIVPILEDGTLDPARPRVAGIERTTLLYDVTIPAEPARAGKEQE